MFRLHWTDETADQLGENYCETMMLDSTCPQRNLSHTSKLHPPTPISSSTITWRGRSESVHLPFWRRPLPQPQAEPVPLWYHRSMQRSGVLFVRMGLFAARPLLAIGEQLRTSLYPVL